MKWSGKIGEFAGIGMYIHATFFLIFAWIILIHWSQGHNLTTILSGIVFVMALFLCVVKINLPSGVFPFTKPC